MGCAILWQGRVNQLRNRQDSVGATDQDCMPQFQIFYLSNNNGGIRDEGDESTKDLLRHLNNVNESKKIKLI